MKKIIIDYCYVENSNIQTTTAFLYLDRVPGGHVWRQMDEVSSSGSRICAIAFRLLVSHLALPGALCNIGYPSEIYLKLKSREISVAHISCFSWPIILKFCTEHGSITAVICAKLQADQSCSLMPAFVASAEVMNMIGKRWNAVYDSVLTRLTWWESLNKLSRRCDKTSSGIFWKTLLHLCDADVSHV